jgi:hypothetical protein
MAQGCVARLCGDQRPAEGDCRAERDRDQEVWDSAEFKEFMNADNEDNGKR